MFRYVRVLSMLVVICGAVRGDDWPQWRGLNRDGISAERIEPWTDSLKIAWRQPAGEGHSSPIVAGGKVFVHAKVAGQEQEELAAYHAETGALLWRKAYGRTPFTSQFGNGPRSTPLVDGDRVYTLGVTGVLTCWETATGAERWKIDILNEFKAANLFFGLSSSPIVEGEKLLVMAGGLDASIVALDKNTGKTLWRSGSDKASYASPIITTGSGGQKMGVFLTQQGVLALNPADGQPFWKFPLVDALNESSTTPVRAGDMLFASSVTYGSVGLRLTSKENKPAYEQAWKNQQLTCYFSTPVAVGEHFYVVTGRLLPTAAQLQCVEAKTGKVTWVRKNVGKYHGTVLLAKDRLLLLEEEGDLVLLEPNPKEYRELARSKVCGHTWAHPALSNGRLFVRDDKELIAVEVRGRP